eukprot:GFUD01031512.1.p1 GENE.GFUD01031512.1~~GFUD01031512.1.p1  ORF type:complete len:315 (-),score=98.13 GFUD01031512.1:124-1029(-)
MLKHVRPLLLQQTSRKLLCPSTLSQLAQFHIWPGSPPSQPPSSPHSCSVLLFGFAGSSPHQLAKQSAVYSSLGYTSLCCILPLQHLFHYDVAKVISCAHLVVEAAYKHNHKQVVIHSLSNNGAILYQHLTQLVATQYKDITIKGAVFDSAPGPGTLLEHLPFPLSTLSTTKYPLSKSFLLYGAYPSVNLANGMKLRDILTASADQARSLKVNWPLNKSVPWPGPYLKHEKADWPLLFLYSKKDKQIHWRYISSVADQQREQGRNVTTHMFSSSGHVAHLKFHPEEYKEALRMFMENACKLS